MKYTCWIAVLTRPIVQNFRLLLGPLARTRLKQSMYSPSLTFVVVVVVLLLLLLLQHLLFLAFDLTASRPSTSRPLAFDLTTSDL
jgi:hypothetical protein